MEKSSESEGFGLTSSKQSKRVPLFFVEMVCFIWDKPDANICAAAVMHASRTAVDKQPVKETTEKIKAMAIALDNKSFSLNCLVEIFHQRN